MRLLILFVLSLTFPDLVHAEEGHHLGKRTPHRILWQDKVRGHQVTVVVHEGGHVLGQPFQVELRVQCGDQEVPLDEQVVQDSFSACDLEPASIKTNRQRTALALKAKAADLNRYYDQIASGQKDPEIHCLERTEIKKLSLNRLCDP